MSMIEKQVKSIREVAKSHRPYVPSVITEALTEAANTIEALSAKLAAANEELERWHTDKINEKIKNPFAWTSTLCCHKCDHKDEYIEELEAANMERSDRYYGGGWIYDRAPTKEECGRWRGKFLVTVYANEPTVMYMEYEYTEIRGKEVSRWIWCDKVNIPWEVIAWRKFPEPYRQ